MDKDFQKMITEKIHFIGANRYKIDTAPEEEQLLQEIDATIDEAAANVTRETGRRITINEGDRYALRWEVIKAILIERGCSEMELDAMAQAVKDATDQAINERKQFIDSFKIVK